MAVAPRFLLLTLFTLVFALTTAGLGLWQISRGQQKEVLAAETVATPVIRMRGEWMANHTVYLDNRSMQGKTGFLVVTPLYIPAQKQAVLVQRGWVARDFYDRNKLPALVSPTGTVEVAGRLVAAPSQYFSLSKDLETGKIRQNLDLAAFSKEIQTPLAAASLQATDMGGAADGLLRQWELVQLSGAKNFGYAAQWFAMCAIAIGLYIWFILIKPRRAKMTQDHSEKGMP